MEEGNGPCDVMYGVSLFPSFFFCLGLGFIFLLIAFLERGLKKTGV